MRSYSTFFAQLVFLVSVVACSTASARTWTDDQGNTIEAEFVRVHRGSAVLLRGGRTMMVPVRNFSPEDQEYIQQQISGASSEAKPGLVEKDEDEPESETTDEPDDKAATGDDEAKTDEAPSPKVTRGKYRVWCDTDGNRLSASFLRVAGSNIVLLKDGRPRSFPFASFSPSDQQYVREQLKARGEEDLVANLLAGGFSRPRASDFTANDAGSRMPRPSVPRMPTSSGSAPRMSMPKMPTHTPPKMPTHTPPKMPTYTPPKPPTHTPTYTPPKPPSRPTPRPPRTPKVEIPERPSPTNRQLPSSQFEEILQCTGCNRQVSDINATSCPHCDCEWSYIEERDGSRTSIPWSRRPRQIVILVVAVLAGLVRLAIRMGRD